MQWALHSLSIFLASWEMVASVQSSGTQRWCLVLSLAESLWVLGPCLPPSEGLHHRRLNLHLL